MSLDKKLHYFFYPENVAVIGASRSISSVGRVVLENFAGHFKGKVFPINPNTEEIMGIKTHKKVSDVREKIDLAVICVPSKFVVSVFKDSLKKKIPAVIIVSAGFNEIGNHELADELKTLINKNKEICRVIGPNCLGVLNTENSVDSLFLPAYKLGRPKNGNISFISQSGALGSTVLDWASMKKYGVSKFISYGNAFDVNELDLIEYLVHDEKTKVICAYIEGLADGRKFFEKIKSLSKKKPVILLKGGTSEKGGKAVLSHTASLAGNNEAFNALFKQTKLIKAENLMELFDFARVFSRLQKPTGNRIQVITDGGGYGILMVDSIEKYGLTMAKPRKETVQKLKKIMPPYVIIDNPIDLTGDATNERYLDTVKACLNDNNIDLLAIIILYQVPKIDSSIIEVIAGLNDLHKKPLVVLSVGGEYSELHQRELEKEGVVNFSYPFEAVKSLKALTEYYK